MVHFIVGEKGKGKTKELLGRVNSEIKKVSGNVCYLDKSKKHMFELNNKVRLIDVSDYLINSSDEFLGFISGIISQDHDLEQMYLDSFLRISCLEDKDITPTIEKLDDISNKYNVDFTLSVSCPESKIPDSLKSKIVVSL